jgi:hypothetical protein
MPPYKTKPIDLFLVAYEQQSALQLRGVQATVKFVPIDRRMIHLTHLRAEVPQQGHGTRFMSFLTELADQTGVMLSLDARPYGEILIPLWKLLEWYGRFNFVETPTETPEAGVAMLRWPAEATASTSICRPSKPKRKTQDRVSTSQPPHYT